METAIDDLFVDPLMWATVSPIQVEAATELPSAARANFRFGSGIPEAVFDHLKRGVYKLKVHCYNNSGTNNAIASIICAISEPLAVYRGGQLKESNVREGLIFPVLTAICKAAPMIPNTSGSSFDTRIIPEDKLCCKVAQEENPRLIISSV